MSDLANSLEPPVPAEEVAAADEQPTQNTEVESKEEVQKEEPDKQKFVPHQALHEERKRRQESEARLRAMEQQQAVLADRYNQILQATQQPQKVPDKETQPLEYIDHEFAQTQRELQEMRQWRQNQEQSAQQQAAANNLAQWALNEASTFAAEKPDFKPAYEHFTQLKAREFEAMGVPRSDIPAAIKSFELGLFYRAHQAGRNPGEVIYEMARGTGYAAKMAATDKIQNLNKGMEASKTLGNGGQQGSPTPEQIAAMSEEEFAEFKAGLAKKGKRMSDVL